MYISNTDSKPLLLKEASMFGKTAVMALLIVCVTVLAFTALVRDSLCELSVRQGGTEIRAYLAYEPRE